MGTTRISRRSALSLCALAAAGCAAPDRTGPAPPAGGGAAVGRFASANPGSVNTFWFPAPDGAVVVDAQRTVSDARAAIAALARSGRPVVAILITHSHPDHVGGLGAWRERFPGVAVFASTATIAQMRGDPGGVHGALGPDPGRGDLTADRTRAVLEAMHREYRDYPSVASLPTLPELNAAAVARELATPAGCCCA